MATVTEEFGEYSLEHRLDGEKYRGFYYKTLEKRHLLPGEYKIQRIITTDARTYQQWASEMRRTNW